VATWEEHASNNLESRAQTEDPRLSWQSPAWPVLLPRNEGRTRQEARQEGSFSFYLEWILDFSSHSAQFLAWGCCVRSGRGVEAFCEFAVVSPSVRGRLAGVDELRRLVWTMPGTCIARPTTSPCIA
jgi:hypothetical protein